MRINENASADMEWDGRARANYFNYINLSHPDTSGMLRFLTDELRDAEDAGDRGELLPWPLGLVPNVRPVYAWC